MYRLLPKWLGVLPMRALLSLSCLLAFIICSDSPFITGGDAVNLDNASCVVEVDQISIVDATVDGAILDLLLKRRTARQGFEIVEIR